MKPASFAYHAPERLDDVLALLADDEREVRVIAGGQSLVPMMNFRLAVPEVLVDLRRAEGLRSLRQEPDGSLTVGARVRQSELLRDRAVAAGCPLLAEGVRHIGHPQVRSRGTVCGALAHHDPHGELPALAVALDATMTVASARGRRTVVADDFFVSYYEVALEPGELLLEVRFPAARPRQGWSFQEIARRRGDFALVGVAAVLEAGDDGRVAAARVVLFGVADRPVRPRAVEEAIVGSSLGGDVLEEVRRLVPGEIDPGSDVHASAEYRREAAAELVSRAVVEAWGRCAHG